MLGLHSLTCWLRQIWAADVTELQPTATNVYAWSTVASVLCWLFSTVKNYILT